MSDESGLEKTVTDLVKESLMLHEGNENKSGKLFAMSLFRGLSDIQYSEASDKVKEMESVYFVFDSALNDLRRGETSPSAVSRALRKQIGDLQKYSASNNNSELYSHLLAKILDDPLPGNSLMYLGAGMGRELINMGIVKSSSPKDRFLKEYAQLEQYLTRA